jgi:hypothetical protein
MIPITEAYYAMPLSLAVPRLPPPSSPRHGAWVAAVD